MDLSSNSIEERNKILSEYKNVILKLRQIEKQIEKVSSSSESKWDELEDKRNGKLKEIEPLIEKYWSWIPSVKLSQCPLCKQDTYRRFDPVDLNGFWWMDRTQRPVDEPETCGHFRLLLGAVSLNGQPCEETLFESDPGPDAPYVIVRILELPTMVAVISTIDMHCGYKAYPICYFSKNEPPAGSLTQSWARKEYYFTNEEGKSGWDIKEELFDYDLLPWIKKGKVYWYVDGQLNAKSSDPESCPFLNLKKSV